MNSMHYNQQQSSQPILQTTQKYSHNQANQKSFHFANVNTSSGAVITGSGNGDSGSFVNTRNGNTRNLLGSHDNSTSNHMNSPKTGTQAQNI